MWNSLLFVETRYLYDLSVGKYNRIVKRVLVGRT